MKWGVSNGVFKVKSYKEAVVFEQALAKRRGEGLALQQFCGAVSFTQ